jgi:hypothetical protein
MNQVMSMPVPTCPGSEGTWMGGQGHLGTEVIAQMVYCIMGTPSASGLGQRVPLYSLDMGIAPPPQGIIVPCPSKGWAGAKYVPILLQCKADSLIRLASCRGPLGAQIAGPVPA